MKIQYLIIISLFLISCKKEQFEYDIFSNNGKRHIEFYTDKTFIIKSKKNEYSGIYKGKFNIGDTITITSTSLNGKKITLTPTEQFIIGNKELIEIKKNGMRQGWHLYDFISFNEIKQIKIRNVDGPHYLNKKEKNEIINIVENSISVGGIICKPQWLALIFEFKNGNKIEGSICGDLINFEDDFSGSFRIKHKINFNNY